MIKQLLSIVFVLLTITASSQNTEMADTFRQEGKIYVVIAVMGIIFLSIVLALFLIERRLSKLEKEMKEKKK